MSILMNDAKYIGLDVHQATISAAVLDSTGKVPMESVLETKAATILQFIHGLRGSLHLGQRRSRYGGEVCEKVAKAIGLGHDPTEKGLAVLNRAEAGDPKAWTASLST
jgi:hypothetical protein